MKQTLLSILIFTALLAVSCKKYENGGSLRKAEDNLTGSTWKLDSYHRNGNDETSSLLISGFTEQFTSEGVIVRSYTDQDGDPFTESGTWQFDSDKMQINLTGVGSIELTEETSTVSTSDYDILKLDKDELWYSYSNGGDLHEFRLKP
jgi:hypothetical protein